MLSKETSIYLNNRDNLTLKQEFNWESSIGKYTFPCVKQIASGKLLYHTGSSAWCSVTIERGGIGWREGGREVWEEGDLCIFMADSYCCMEETNTTVQSNYPPIKNKWKNTNKAKKNKQKNSSSPFWPQKVISYSSSTWGAIKMQMPGFSCVLAHRPNVSTSSQLHVPQHHVCRLKWWEYFYHADSEGQGSLACCSSWGHKEWDTICCCQRLNNKKTSWKLTSATNLDELVASIYWQALPGSTLKDFDLQFGNRVF